MGEFFYRFISSRLAVGSSVSIFFLLLAAAMFRIIPWWLFLVVVLLGVTGVAAYWIVKEWLALRRDKSFERGMSQQAETQIASRKARDRDAIRDMHERWKEGFDRLKSMQKRGRRAVYFLPWYLIIGKPATGKTTAIKNAGLHFPLGTPKTAGTGGTRNCDWFFTEEAILLDTAGRYADSDENQADRDEWIAFLRLLRKYRRDMPINGVMVAVAADDLLGRDRDEITEDARGMRSKLGELLEELGIQFPVYLLITKCDLVQGFTEFFGRLPKARLTELLGWTKESWETDDLLEELGGAFAGLRDRCRALRPVFLRDEENPTALRNVYLFPEELDALTKNLAQYCDVLFRETKYADSPFLRGMYLTSGMQTGTTVSRILGRLGLSAQASRVSEGSRSFFLQDFFQQRLKADDKLVAPTGRSTIRFRVAHNVGLAAAIGLCTLIGLFATASYVRNRTLLLSIEDAVVATRGLEAAAPADQMAQLDDYRAAIETLRYRNRHRSWLERFGLYSGAAAENPVVNRFMEAYDTVGYRPALGQADVGITDRESAQRAFAAFDALVSYLVVAGQAKYAPPSAGGESLAAWWNRIAVEDEAARDRFAAAYRFYLHEPWRREDNVEWQERATQDYETQRALVRENLPGLLTVDRVRHWLADGTPVRGTDFDLPPGAAGTAMVPAAFTPPAWEQRVRPMLHAVQEVEPAAAPTFATAYATRYYDSWRQFVLDLKQPQSGSRYDGRKYCEADSPYIAVLAAVHDATTSPFLTQPAQRREPAAEAEAEPKGDAPAAAAEAASNGKPIAGLEPPPWVPVLGRVVREREKYIEQMKPACNATGGLDDSCTGAVDLPFAPMRQWIRNTLLAVNAAEDPNDRRIREHVARLLDAPVDRAEYQSTTGCAGTLKGALVEALQRFPSRPPWTLDQVEAIFAPSGSVWAYCDQTLSRFFNCGSLSPKPSSPVHVPADITGFLRRADRIRRTFFNPGGGWRTHMIALESIPGTSETGALVTQTILEVFCSNSPEQPWRLSHRQTRVKKSLSWQPDQCGEARLQVTLGTPDGGASRVVEIVKPGPFGFLDLLRAAEVADNEFRWHFDEGVTAAFRVWLPDRGVFELAGVTLPQ
jgi:type VI protein secretion system component VasK